MTINLGIIKFPLFVVNGPFMRISIKAGLMPSIFQEDLHFEAACYLHSLVNI